MPEQFQRVLDYRTIKLALALAFTIISFEASSQDSKSRINQIDSLVTGINTSNLRWHRDTLIQDHPDLGLKMVTYLTAITKDDKLFKYVNMVHTLRTENGVTKQMETSTSFYYFLNKLIKVEEYFIQDTVNKKLGDWYFWDEKPLYFTSTSEKAASRATLLLSMSKGIKEQVVR